jgi:hypothetical protein
LNIASKNLYVCPIEHDGEIVAHKNIKACPQALMKLIKPYLDGLVIVVECLFSRYWIADFCEDNGIDFVLGHLTQLNSLYVFRQNPALN